MAEISQKQCGYNGLKKVSYFHGMLVNEDDFNDEQAYHVKKRKLLNQAVYGSGVVCGLSVTWDQQNRYVTIDAGLALDCHGNEIYLCKPFTVDVIALLSAKRQAGACPPDDGTQNDNFYYLCIRYHEKESDSVPVYVPAGGCDPGNCAPSRCSEGYCVDLVRKCTGDNCDAGVLGFLADAVGTQPQSLPAAGIDAFQQALSAFATRGFRCPEPCVDDGCVILGRIELNVDGTAITGLNMKACRSYVWTPRLLKYLACQLLSPVTAGPQAAESETEGSESEKSKGPKKNQSRKQ